MTIPSQINALIERLNQELAQTEAEVVAGLTLVRSRLESQPEDPLLITLFASLKNITLFVDNTKRQIRTIIEELSSDEPNTIEKIQEAGEDLATQLGGVIEAKIFTVRVKTRLENLS
jgi:hypothetical protein